MFYIFYFYPFSFKKEQFLSFFLYFPLLTALQITCFPSSFFLLLSNFFSISYFFLILFYFYIIYCFMIPQLSVFLSLSFFLKKNFFSFQIPLIVFLIPFLLLYLSSKLLYNFFIFFPLSIFYFISLFYILVFSFIVFIHLFIFTLYFYSVYFYTPLFICFSFVVNFLHFLSLSLLFSFSHLFIHLSLLFPIIKKCIPIIILPFPLFAIFFLQFYSSSSPSLFHFSFSPNLLLHFPSFNLSTIF